MPRASRTPDSTPRRPTTPSEREHELAMAVALRQRPGTEYSGSLTRNAKGDVQIDWAAKGDDPAAVLEALRDGFAHLCALYPRTDKDPTTQPEGS